MSVLLYSLLLVFQLTFIYTAIPRVYNRCLIWDTACLTQQAQLKVPALSIGIPELFAEPLDPMNIDYLHVDIAGLKMDLNKAVIRGIRNSVIDQFSVDPVSKQVLLVYHTDLDLKSRYTAAGNVLSLPFNGDGEALISAKKLQVAFLMPFDVVKDGLGRDVIDLKGYQYWYDVDNIHFDYSNLFYGNKALSDNMHQFLNTNWKFVTSVYGRSLLDVINGKIFNSMRNYFLSQAVEDVFLD
ncbi:unnamed protein product [Leptosia nina]|uniref:Uncharacterized protein n=1 Tax=Leptosia nina TaxID=320188 RepID=A0AAV1K417_9NEOP